jgi:hypothetical protein
MEQIGDRYRDPPPTKQGVLGVPGYEVTDLFLIFGALHSVRRGGLIALGAAAITLGVQETSQDDWQHLAPMDMRTGPAEAEKLLYLKGPYWLAPQKRINNGRGRGS